jgi:hypothetical protein
MKSVCLAIVVAMVVLACAGTRRPAEKRIAVAGPKGPSDAAELAICELLLRIAIAESKRSKKYFDSGRPILVGSVRSVKPYGDPPSGLVDRLSDIPVSIIPLSEHPTPDQPSLYWSIGVKIIRWNGMSRAEAIYTGRSWAQKTYVEWHLGKWRIHRNGVSITIDGIGY